jgi:hypothetical protein
VRVLAACEYSGVVRDAFIAAGHDALSCDLLPTDSPGPHHQGDVLELLDQNWDLMVAHPPCTYLTRAGLHWNKRVPGRAELTEEALDFVRRLMAAPIPRIALENPPGCIGTRIDARQYGFATRKATQSIQPYEHGHDAGKLTSLWLKNLPPLMPTRYVEGRVVGTDKRGNPIMRWANQTDSGQNRLGPSEDRWKLRSTTYAGIGAAMADQWGRLDDISAGPVAEQQRA